MNNLKNKILLITILRWIARIWSIASIAFLSFMLIASIVGAGEENGGFASSREVVQFLFFPLGILIGMIIAWKWEGLGGIITTGSIIVFHVFRPDLIFEGMFDVLAVPGLLFLACWLLSRGQQLETKEAD
jgi:hypothetical protein